MTESIAPLLQWLNDHPSLSGLVIFLISAGESVAVLGTIVPGTVMMTAIGAIAGAGVIPLWSAIMWAMLGAIVGDGISYWIGHYFKDRLHNVWPFKTRPQMLKKGEVFFEKYGGMSVFIGRFVGPVRALVPLVAGMLRMKPMKFYLANIVSAILWAPVYMFPGILLGVASQELPPDIAVHALLNIVLISLFIILCLWLGYKLLVVINRYIVKLFSQLWPQLERSRFSYPVTILFKHHTNKMHAQLALVFYLFLMCILFGYLVNHLLHIPSTNLIINDSLFHFFRSIRTPALDNIMLSISLLGEKFILLPVMLALVLWFAHTKQWRTACHVLIAGVLITVCAEAFKSYVHSPRPWGIQQSPSGYSFPSGHTALATVFYFGLGLLLIQGIRWKKTVWWLSAILVILVSISRVYLGAHWLTDVIGGWLLGTIVLMVVLLSYNRWPEKNPLQPKNILYVILIVLFMTYTAYYFTHIKKLRKNYTQIDWPTYHVSLDTWWAQQGEHLPFFRVNRFGLSDEVLNIQWFANLDGIKKLLLKNGWEIPPNIDWIDVLHRLSDIKSTEHLPLVSPIYFDEKPSLVLIKHTSKNKKFIVMRLWSSQVLINNATLWVGVVNEVPRTYSWIFKHSRIKQVTITPSLIFTNPPTFYDIKQLQVKGSHNKDQIIILIKPNTGR